MEKLREYESLESLQKKSMRVENLYVGSLVSTQNR